MRDAQAHSFYQGPAWWNLFEQEAARPSDARFGYAVAEEGAGPDRTVWAVLPLMHMPLLLPQGENHLVSVLKRWVKRVIEGHTLQAMSNYYTGLYAPTINPHAQPVVLPTLLRALRLRHWDPVTEQSLAAPSAATAEPNRPSGQAPSAPRLEFAPLDELECARMHSALEAAGYRCRIETAFGNWYEPVEPGEAGFKAYWSRRPGALRNTVARAARRFSRAGGTIEITDGQDRPALARARQAYEQVYRRSWKPPEALEGFIPAFTDLAAREGWLRLGVAWLNGQPVAAHLWLVSGSHRTSTDECHTPRRAEIFKLAYDESAAAASAGSLLGYEMMKRVMVVDEVREVDYLSGDDGYKALWMCNRRQRWRVVGF